MSRGRSFASGQPSAILGHPKDFPNPARGLVLLRPVQTEETLAGGKIALLGSTRERWTGQQAEVVAVGADGTCDDREVCERTHYTRDNGIAPRWYHHCFLKPGDWVILEPRQFVELEDKLWLAPQDAVLARIVI